ncbi:hypothetical protein [Kistimonas asteriae]|uniref:hypothetical protein n=1 Tax=Kistimonas asteriae TaxID=517724 RepID=UPI001BAD273C|nr:hypothetical protein [Kistimonas asteriae]
MKANMRPVVPPKPLHYNRKPIRQAKRRNVGTSEYALRGVKRCSTSKREEQYLAGKYFQTMMAKSKNGVTRLSEYNIQYAELDLPESKKKKSCADLDSMTEYQVFKGKNEAGQTVIGIESSASSLAEPLYEPIEIGAQLKKSSDAPVRQRHRSRRRIDKRRRLGKRRCRIKLHNPKVKVFFKKNFSGKKIRERLVKLLDAITTLHHNVVQRTGKEKGQIVTVKMGESKNASGSGVLFTEGMSYCSSFILLSDFDKEKGIYKRRQMMHVPGSHLEQTVKQEDGSTVMAKNVLMDFLEGEKGEERKLIIAHGASNITEYSHEITLNQMYDGRSVIRELMADHDISIHQCNAASIKVDASGCIVEN